MKTDLVRPGDISDAVDAQDLLDQFLAKNLNVIGDKREQRLRSDWIDEEARRIRKQYADRARTAYEKMWKECAKTKLGHSFNRIDVKGYSLDQCSICSHTQGEAAKIKNSYSSGFTTDDSPVRLAEEMNSALISTMSNRMIELDENAGILVWPQPEEMPERVLRQRLRGKN